MESMKTFFIFLAALVAIIVILYKSGKKSMPAPNGPEERPNPPSKEPPARVRIVVDETNEDDADDWLTTHNKEHLQEAIQKGDKKEILYYQGKLDPVFQKMESEFWGARNSIKEMQVDKRASKADFEKACLAQMQRAFAFKPIYEKYYCQPLNADIFKTYALFLEREGRYVEAATVCVRALDQGFPNDGTQGGMAGRLVRMIKKAGGETTNEIEDALNRYCR